MKATRNFSLKKSWMNIVKDAVINTLSAGTVMVRNTTNGYLAQNFKIALCQQLAGF